MWWSPNEDEQQTSETVARLSKLFIDPDKSLPEVYGVGSTIDTNKRRVPLLVLDRLFVPISLLDRIGMSRALYNLFSLMREYRSTLIPLEASDSNVRELLKAWEVPGDTRLLFSDPPMAVRSVIGSRVWAPSKKHARVGFLLKINKGRVTTDALTTAGHLVNSTRCSVFTRFRSPLLRERFERIGSVSFKNDPTNAAGADVAVVELSPHLPSDWEARRSQAKSQSLANVNRVPDFGRVTLFRGNNHVRKGWIDGALQVTRSFDGRIWKNCWSVMEYFQGFARPGDSGAPVFLGNDMAVGHLVGTLGIRRPFGWFQGGLVQDIHTVVESVKDHYKQPITVMKF